MLRRCLTFTQFRIQAKERGTIVPRGAYRWIQRCRLVCESTEAGRQRRTYNQWWECLHCYTTEQAALWT